MTTGQCGPLVTLWSAAMRSDGQSHNTIKRRTGTLNRFSEFIGRDARTASPDDIVLFLGAHDWAKNTRAAYYGDLHAWWTWMQLSGREERDPTARVRRPRMVNGAPRPVETEDLMRVLSITTGDDLVMVELGAYQALRRAEISAVAGEDFDLGAGIQYVTGKGGVRDAIALHPLLAAEAGRRPRTGPWFPGGVDGHLSPHRVGMRIRASFEAVGLPGVTAHRLRHWSASQLLRAGASTRQVQQHLRHRALTSTQIYTRVVLDDVAARLTQLPTAS